MFDQFKSKAEAVGAEVYRFDTKDQALAFILEICANEKISKAPLSGAVWADSSFFNDGHKKEELEKKVPGLTFDVTCASATDSRIGITEMSWALADTGSLVADQTAAPQRLASTLPAMHIAVVDIENILPDKTAVFTRITPKSSRYIAFITGPSRTADIERVLTIGVHGPRRLIILFVGSPKGGAA